LGQVFLSLKNRVILSASWRIRILVGFISSCYIRHTDQRCVNFHYIDLRSFLRSLPAA